MVCDKAYNIVSDIVYDIIHEIVHDIVYDIVKATILSQVRMVMPEKAEFKVTVIDGLTKKLMT